MTLGCRGLSIWPTVARLIFRLLAWTGSGQDFEISMIQGFFSVSTVRSRFSLPERSTLKFLCIMVERNKFSFKDNLVQCQHIFFSFISPQLRQWRWSLLHRSSCKLGGATFSAKDFKLSPCENILGFLRWFLWENNRIWFSVNTVISEISIPRTPLEVQ